MIGPSSNGWTPDWPATQNAQGKLLPSRKVVFKLLTLFAQDIKVQANDLWTGQNQNFKNKHHPTIFHALLNVNAGEKHPGRLWQEGFLVIGA